MSFDAYFLLVFADVTGLIETEEDDDTMPIDEAYRISHALDFQNKAITAYPQTASLIQELKEELDKKIEFRNLLLAAQYGVDRLIEKLNTLTDDPKLAEDIKKTVVGLLNPITNQ